MEGKSLFLPNLLVVFALVLGWSSSVQSDVYSCLINLQSINQAKKPVSLWEMEKRLTERNTYKDAVPMMVGDLTIKKLFKSNKRETYGVVTTLSMWDNNFILTLFESAYSLYYKDDDTKAVTNNLKCFNGDDFKTPLDCNLILTGNDKDSLFFTYLNERYQLNADCKGLPDASNPRTDKSPASHQLRKVTSRHLKRMATADK